MDLPEVSELEVALSQNEAIISHDIYDDIKRRGLKAGFLPWLTAPEVELAEGIRVNYVQSSKAAKEAEHPDADINVEALMVAGLRLAKRADRLIRLSPTRRPLVPPALVVSDQIKNYADSLFEDRLLYVATRPYMSKLAEILPNWVAPLPDSSLGLPAKERRRIDLKHELVSVALLSGFIALDKSQLAEVEGQTVAEDNMTNWPASMISRLRASEVIDNKL